MTAQSQPPPEPELLWEVGEGGVARLTLNRPHAGNAITGPQREALIARLAAASADPRVRAIVLTATGDRHFCTGADLTASPPPAPAPVTTPAPAPAPVTTLALAPDVEARDVPGRPAGSEARDVPERPAEATARDVPGRPVGAVARAVAGGAQRLVSAVLDCEKPVVAAVNGTAAGIGCHLAYACDLVLAADSARFIEVFVRRGLVVDGGGAYLLTRLVGPRRAKELIFFGDELPAVEAERIGLVNRVVPAGELAGTAADLAARLAAGPTVALGLGKRLVNRALDVDRATSLAEEALAAEINMTSEDGQEGLRAFLERRSPRFRGW